MSTNIRALEMENIMKICLENSSKIMENYMPLLISMSRKFSKYEVDESIDECRMILIESILTYDCNKGSFGNYLKLALTYHFLDKSKKEDEISLYQISDRGAFLLDELEDDSNILEELLVGDSYEFLYKSLDTLKNRDQKIIKLRFFYGFEIEKIGELLNISPKTVQNRISLILSWLRDKMKGERLS